MLIRHLGTSSIEAGTAAIRRAGISGAVSLFAISLVSNLMMLAGPLFMLQVYDRVLTSKSVPTLVALVLLIAAVYGLYALIETLRARMSLRLASLVEHAIGGRLFAAAVMLRMASSVPTMADPVRDGDQLRSFLAGPAPLALLDVPWVPIYLGLVFLIHPDLGWLATAGAVVLTLVMLISEFALRRPTRESGSATALRQRQSDDARANAEAIVAMGMLGDLTRRASAHTQAMLRLQRIAGDRAALSSSLTKAIRLLLQSLVLGLGAYVVIRGEMTGGLMIAASVVTSRALAPIEQTIAQWRQFVGARQVLRHIRGYLGMTGKSEPATSLPLPRQILSVRGFSAAAPGSRTPIISGIHFDLSAGDGLGILGLSGSGKSSLARSLCGAWSALAGEIRFDGATLAHYQHAQLGRIIGYLPQRADLLEGTIADNIGRFTPGARSEDIVAAARLADVHQLILSLPQGYDMPVGVAGDNLSAGQRQRIGLARALFGNPFLVVLDEPNANLDAEGEVALTAAIRSMRARGSIVVVVAHRPSALVALDTLLFMKDGRQVAFGAKSDVLEQITGSNVQPLRVSA